MAKAGEIERKWYVIDAEGKHLGRLAAEAAAILRGKHKPIFTPHVDTGDHVIVINADKVVLTGDKQDKKIYYRHSGYPGGLKSMTYRTFLARKPEEAVRKAIVGMLPHNKLGAQMAKKLKVYRGPEHPHEAQKPEVWSR
ncbi:MAG: 50S ribosomal protein L13 [Bacillota bacterium]